MDCNNLITIALQQTEPVINLLGRNPPSAFVEGFAQLESEGHASSTWLHTCDQITVQL
ncbi:protein of unknown function [Hyphomicrobium sp. 1Nfss2.1]